MKLISEGFSPEKCEVASPDIIYGYGSPYERKADITLKKQAYLTIKRIFDVVASLLGLLLTSPILLAAAIAIKLQDGGPVIHTRVCLGRDGKTYKMYKFRTMVMDADNLERWLTPEQIREYTANCKLDNDPRITKPGHFLRKTSIDELPQLLSTLKGNMSLVGPRPVVSREADAYGADKELLLSVKPGITGWWQVSARSSIPFLSEEAKSLQLYYATHCSLLLDVKILFMTVAVVLGRRGAK